MPTFAILNPDSMLVRLVHGDAGLAELFPNTSNPSLLEPAVLRTAGVVPVIETPATAPPEPGGAPPLFEWQPLSRYNAQADAWEVSGEWVLRTADAIQRDRRARRKLLLTQCDWTALPDAPLTGEQKAAWARYRQGLRDITAQATTSPTTWPTPPA